MEANKILFVGLGGAGQRHLRIFRELLPPETEFSAFRAIKKTPLLKSDFSIDMDSTVEKQFALKLFNSLEEAFDNDPDLVVISTPTSLHYEVARMAAERSIDIFIEKPFSHNLEGFDEFKDIVLKNNLICFISFQRRFHPYLSKIKELIETEKLGKIITANFNVGSYVPAWHPYEDFRELYACRSDLGGGVLLTEIHEIDLCYWYFGLPDYVYCAGGNYSDVKLDVEDTIHLTLKYSNFAVQVNLCFMQKHNRRDLYIAGTKGYVEWSMEGNKLILNNYSKSKKEILADPELTNDAMFYSQNSYFLNKLNRSDNKIYIEVAGASLAIVEAAKESMAKGVDVKVLPFNNKNEIMNTILQKFRLNNKVAIITGGAGLLGVKHAEAIAEAGGIPILWDINSQAVQDRSREIAERYDVSCLGMSVDITDHENVKTGVNEVLKTLQRIDILINNAANDPKVAPDQSPAWSRLENLSLNMWQKDIAVGLNWHISL